MDLEWFMSNISNKVIQLEFGNSDGDLVTLIKLVVSDAEIERMTHFDILTINENIRLYFEDFEINHLDNCLSFYRKNVIFLNIYLPNDEEWKETKACFAQY